MIYDPDKIYIILKVFAEENGSINISRWDAEILQSPSFININEGALLEYIRYMTEKKLIEEAPHVGQHRIKQPTGVDYYNAEKEKRKSLITTQNQESEKTGLDIKVAKVFLKTTFLPYGFAFASLIISIIALITDCNKPDNTSTQTEIKGLQNSVSSIRETTSALFQSMDSLRSLHTYAQDSLKSPKAK